MILVRSVHYCHNSNFTGITLVARVQPFFLRVSSATGVRLRSSWSRGQLSPPALGVPALRAGAGRSCRTWGIGAIFTTVSLVRRLGDGSPGPGTTWLAELLPAAPGRRLYVLPKPSDLVRHHFAP